MRSIELTFGVRADAAVRSDWAALSAAGLASLDKHTGATHRPHLTLTAGPALSDGVHLRAAFAALPLSLRFGGFIVFGSARHGFVLARQIVVSRALLEMHALVHASAPGALEQTRPDRWVPHVTIARRLDPVELSVALELLEDRPPIEAVAARLWDSASRTVTALQ